MLIYINLLVFLISIFNTSYTTHYFYTVSLSADVCTHRVPISQLYIYIYRSADLTNYYLRSVANKLSAIMEQYCGIISPTKFITQIESQLRFPFS